MKFRSIRKLLSLVALIIVTAGLAAAGTPSAPTPLSPAAGASVQAPFTISWSAVTDPSGIIAYNWQVSPSSTFPTVILQNSTMGQTQDTVSGLANGTYYWRVQAVNAAFVQGTWSTPRSFTITGAAAGALSPPTLAPPQGYSTFHPLEVMTFNWTAVPGAVKYLAQFSSDSSFPVSTSVKFDNIPGPTISFAAADENFYFARVFAIDANGLASAPSNTINYSVFYNNPISAPPAPLSPGNGTTLTLPITVTWTDVLNPQPSGYELEIAKDSSFSNIEEDDPQLNNASRTVLSLTAGTKYWRVRSHQGDSSPTTAAVTKWSASGSFTVNPAPPSPVSLTLTSNPIYSGNSSWVQVQLTSAAPSGGATIALTSSNPAVLPVPATINMPGNIAWTQFQVQAGQVTSSTQVTLTATLNSNTTSTQVTVLPPSLKSITISPSMISGGAQAGAIVMMNGQAPAGGAVVSLLSDSAAAMPPALATIAAGSYSVFVPVPTNTVAANTLATITADWNGQTVQGQFTLTPQGQPASLTLSPSSVTGSAGSLGVVTMAAPSTVDQTFQVTSNSPVALVANSVTIPAGATSAGFNISTIAPTAQTSVTISVTGGGVTRSAILTVSPFSTTPTPAPGTAATLTVSASGRSGERITSSPAGISVAVGSTGSASFASGTAITLSVSNGRDAVWSGACSSNGQKAKTCSFTLTANASVSGNVQ